MDKKKKEYPWTDKPAGKIAGTILQVQAKVSNEMNKFLNQLSAQKLRIVLAVFCLSWGSFSIYNIFFNKPVLPQPAKVKMVQHPADLPEPPIDNGILEQIDAYKKYMDSTGETIRPSLLDSMQVLEQIYSQQQK